MKNTTLKQKETKNQFYNEIENLKPTWEKAKEYQVKIKNINWDTDKQKIKLPKEIKLIIDTKEEETEEDIEMYISDFLSNEYGYCHNGFYMQIISKKEIKYKTKIRATEITIAKN